MRYKLSNKTAQIFRKAGVHWAQQSYAGYDIHKVWLEACVESGFVKSYEVVNEHAVVTFHDNPELFKVYKKTIVNEHERGVIIEYNSALNELYQRGYDGWSFDPNHDLYGEYLIEYIKAMGEIHSIQSNIINYGEGV